jgi:hypothetical protein
MAVAARYWKPLLVMALLAYAGGAALQYWKGRALVPAWPAAAAAATAPAAQPAPRVDALDMLFGLSPTQAPVASAAALVLRASIVGTAGASRVLLAGGAVERFYREGDSLPDGSVLRDIQADHVLLWRGGREERLKLDRSAQQHLRPAPQPAALRVAPPNPLLRPRPITEAQP